MITEHLSSQVLGAERGFFEPRKPRRAVPLFVYSGIAEIAGAQVSYTYREPTDEAMITDEVPLAITPGWGGPELAYRSLGVATAEMGKPSITYNAPRSKGLHDLNPYHLFKVAKFASQAAWGVMRDVKDTLHHELFDVYGHFLGGQTAVNVALHKPQHVRGVILDGSCGLENTTLREMINRTGQFGKEELWPALPKLARGNGPMIGLQALHYIFRNPPRTLAEGLNAGSANLHPHIKELVARGIGAAAIQSPKDIYFHAEAVERDASHLFGDRFHVRHDPEANHLAPQLDPYGTAQAIMHLLGQRPELTPAAQPEPGAAAA